MTLTESLYIDCFLLFQKFHSRDDYKELIELCILFLGERPNETYNFRAPAAMHHARWMSKALYSLKIYMFKKQFKLSNKETDGLAAINIFIVRYYLRAWFTATDAVSSPNND